MTEPAATFDPCGSQGRVRIHTLRDPASLDPNRVGAKAAHLARAQAAGLPVAAGLVVPVAAAVSTLREALDSIHVLGTHGAQLTVMDADMTDLAGLPSASADVGDRLVVRSSSPLEDSTAWAGAFASYVDVAPDQVLTAVRGVWASVLNRDVLERACEARVDLAAVGMAVLVQAQVRPDFAGTAEVEDDGTVVVVAVRGAPAGLLSGWDRGADARCAPDGTVHGVANELLHTGTILQVAELARAAHRTMGDALIEWAAVDDEPLLLQSTGRRYDAARAPSPELHGRASAFPDNAVAVAHAARRYAGSTGELLVLPWLIAGDTPRSRIPPPDGFPIGAVPEPLQAWDDALALASELATDTWGGAHARQEVQAVLAELQGGEMTTALRTLARLRSPDRTRAALLGMLLDRVSSSLVLSGTLSSAEQLWSLAPGDVRRVLRGGVPAGCTGEDAGRKAALRWESFCFTAVMDRGSRATGDPASDGTAAGPVAYVRDLPLVQPLPPRAVVIAPRPIPQLAPLLWGASALVTFGGSRAAHVIEVARSRRVPAVVGCAVAERILTASDGEYLAAVDGDTGVVVVSEARRDGTGQAGGTTGSSR